MSTPAGVEIRYGYTLADLDHLVRGVLFMDRWHRGMDVAEKAAVARLAILEALHAAPHWPQRHDLLRAGSAALSDYVRRERAYAGRPRDNAWADDGTLPRWVLYWEWATRNTPSHEHGVIERQALWQIWPRLSDTHRLVLGALAAHGDYQNAAAALGKNPGTFQVQVSHARREFRRLWHEGETPRGAWGTDRRADRKGEHARRGATAALRRRSGKPRSVDTGVHNAHRYANHGCRCDVCTEGATREARNRRRANGTTPRRRITESQLVDIRARQAAGESLAAIARDLGFADSYLSRLLSGKRKPAKDGQDGYR